MVWYKIVKKLVFRVVWGFHRRTAEGSPKGRRKRILADINARPPDEREPGNCRDRIATHSGRDGAGREKKEKAPKEKSPQQKKRKRCLRLLLLTGGCAALLSCFSPPLASSYGGCAATLPSLLASLLPLLHPPLMAAAPPPPFCPLHASLASCGRLRRPLSSLALLFLAAALRAAAPSCPPISLRLKTSKNAVTSHEFFFFCHNITFLS